MVPASPEVAGLEIGERITRAEVIRRFTNAERYALLSRTNSTHAMPIPEDQGKPRRIARVTNSGVYIGNLGYIITTFPAAAIATWSEGTYNGRPVIVQRQGAGNIGVTTIVYDLEPLPSIDEALHERLAAYAHKLRAEGFTVYLPIKLRTPRAADLSYNFFHYSRTVDGRECYGIASMPDFPMFNGQIEHTMPLTPSRLNGSGAHIGGALEGAPVSTLDADSVDMARAVARPTNYCPFNAEPTREATERANSGASVPQKFYKGATLQNAKPDGIGARFFPTVEV
jgi:hypothetical protein